jgi:very-short-patch-repair endonuclease
LAIPDLVGDRSHLAAACLSEPGAVASHRAAALLLDLDGVEEDVVEVSTRGGVRSRHGRTHRSSDLLRRDLIVVDSITTTNATRTCCDLGKVAPLEVVERVVESALRQRATTLCRLETRLGELSRPGRPGPATLRRVLALRGAQAATESDFETLALQCFRAANVPEPERQYVIRHEGRFVARTDLAWPHARVYGELDGRKDHEAWADTVRDRRRQNALARAGWMPARFTWGMIVYEGPATAAELVGILDERMRRAS